MDDWEPYHQDERDVAVEKGGYALMLLLSLIVMLVIVALVLSLPDVELPESQFVFPTSETWPMD